MRDNNAPNLSTAAEALTARLMSLVVETRNGRERLRVKPTEAGRYSVALLPLSLSGRATLGDTAPGNGPAFLTVTRTPRGWFAYVYGVATYAETLSTVEPMAAGLGKSAVATVRDLCNALSLTARIPSAAVPERLDAFKAWAGVADAPTTSYVMESDPDALERVNPSERRAAAALCRSDVMRNEAAAQVVPGPDGSGVVERGTPARSLTVRVRPSRTFGGFRVQVLWSGRGAGTPVVTVRARDLGEALDKAAEALDGPKAPEPVRYHVTRAGAYAPASRNALTPLADDPEAAARRGRSHWDGSRVAIEVHAFDPDATTPTGSVGAFLGLLTPSGEWVPAEALDARTTTPKPVPSVMDPVRTYMGGRLVSSHTDVAAAVQAVQADDTTPKPVPGVPFTFPDPADTDPAPKAPEPYAPTGEAVRCYVPDNVREAIQAAALVVRSSVGTNGVSVQGFRNVSDGTYQALFDGVLGTRRGFRVILSRLPKGWIATAFALHEIDGGKALLIGRMGPTRGSALRNLADALDAAASGPIQYTDPGERVMTWATLRGRPRVEPVTAEYRVTRSVSGPNPDNRGGHYTYAPDAPTAARIVRDRLIASDTFGPDDVGALDVQAWGGTVGRGRKPIGTLSADGTTWTDGSDDNDPDGSPKPVRDETLAVQAATRPVVLDGVTMPDPDPVQADDTDDTDDLSLAQRLTLADGLDAAGYAWDRVTVGLDTDAAAIDLDDLTDCGYVHSPSPFRSDCARMVARESAYGLDLDTFPAVMDDPDGSGDPWIRTDVHGVTLSRDVPCYLCEGNGGLTDPDDMTGDSMRDCPRCNADGYVDGPAVTWCVYLVGDPVDDDTRTDIADGLANRAAALRAGDVRTMLGYSDAGRDLCDHYDTWDLPDALGDKVKAWAMDLVQAVPTDALTAAYNWAGRDTDAIEAIARTLHVAAYGLDDPDPLGDMPRHASGPALDAWAAFVHGMGEAPCDALDAFGPFGLDDVHEALTALGADVEHPDGLGGALNDLDGVAALFGVRSPALVRDPAADPDDPNGYRAAFLAASMLGVMSDDLDALSAFMDESDGDHTDAFGLAERWVPDHCGTETLTDPSDPDDVVVRYLNMGDTYARTILAPAAGSVLFGTFGPAGYHEWTQERPWVGSYGDAVEWLENAVIASAMPDPGMGPDDPAAVADVDAGTPWTGPGTLSVEIMDGPCLPGYFRGFSPLRGTADVCAAVSIDPWGSVGDLLDAVADAFDRSADETDGDGPAFPDDLDGEHVRAAFVGLFAKGLRDLTASNGMNTYAQEVAYADSPLQAAVDALDDMDGDGSYLYLRVTWTPGDDGPDGTESPVLDAPTGLVTLDDVETARDDLDDAPGPRSIRSMGERYRNVRAAYVAQTGHPEDLPAWDRAADNLPERVDVRRADVFGAFVDTGAYVGDLCAGLSVADVAEWLQERAGTLGYPFPPAFVGIHNGAGFGMAAVALAFRSLEHSQGYYQPLGDDARRVAVRLDGTTSPDAFLSDLTYLDASAERDPEGNPSTVWVRTRAYLDAVRCMRGVAEAIHAAGPDVVEPVWDGGPPLVLTVDDVKTVRIADDLDSVMRDDLGDKVMRATLRAAGRDLKRWPKPNRRRRRGAAAGKGNRPRKRRKGF